MTVVLILAMFLSVVPAQAVTVTPDGTYRFYMVGNSHIDTAWRWPIQHTAEVIIRDTFTRQVNALKGNSTYKFTSSCATHYIWTKEYYPAMYADIQDLYSKGQWGIAGGQMVEPDLNVMEGEAFARHGLYGQHFFLEEFGTIATVALVPDVFGFSGQFPQFIRKTGMTAYVATKMNWSSDPADGALDPGPWSQSANGQDSRGRESDIFWWEALDGTDVLSYNCYNDYTSSYSTPDFRNSSNAVFNRLSRSGSFTLNGQPGYANGTYYYDYDSNLKYALGMFGEGDHGGGPTAGTGGGQHGWPAANSGGTNGPTVLPATLEDYFYNVRQPSAKRVAANSVSLEKVYRHVGENYLSYHRGTYTSWSRVKKYNRQMSNLGQTAEAAATLAFWTKTLANNSSDKIQIGWDRILVNTMHDILPGSSGPPTYYQAYMGYELSNNLFTNIQNNALVALAYRADTTVDEGVPVFVYNSMNWQRDGETSTTVTLDRHYDYIKVFDGTTELPVTVNENKASGVAKISFIAKAVPSLGYKVYKVVGSDTPSTLTTDVIVSENASAITVENENLRFTISKTTGNMPSLINKKDGNREVFYQTSTLHGNELQFKQDTGGGSFPAWDMTNSEFGGVAQAFSRVNTVAETPSIVVNTPEKVTIKVVQSFTDSANPTPSVAARYITLLAGSDRIDVRFELDWQMYQRNLKVAFPVNVDAFGASYEIAYGAMDGAAEVKRMNTAIPASSASNPLMANSVTGAPAYAGAIGRSTIRDTRWNSARFEHSGHKWMDVTNDAGTYGMSILNDAKYGYDVLRMVRSGSSTAGTGTDDQIAVGGTYVRTRMTVVRSPMSANNDYEREKYQPTNQVIDIGYQDFNYSIYPHAGTWQDAETSREAHELNYPLVSFQTAQGNGGLGKSKSFLGVNKSNVKLGALKNQHDDQADMNTFIVRLWETNGKDTPGVVLTLPANVISVKEVNMLEHDYDELSNDNIDNPVSKKMQAKTVSVSGDTVIFDIGHYETLTLQIKIAPFSGAPAQFDQETVNIASFYNLRGTSPDSNRRAANLDGAGNSIPEPLWVSARAAKVDYQGIKFELGPETANNFVTAQGQTIPVNKTGYNKLYILGAGTGNVAKAGLFTVNYDDGTSFEKEITFADWRSPLTGWAPLAKMDLNPYVYDSIAHVFTHWHDSTNDQMTLDNYLYAYSIDVDEVKTVTSINLPVAAGIKIAGISAVYTPIPGFVKVFESSDIDKPDPPTDVTAVELTATSTRNIQISWTAPADTIVRAYTVYAGATPDFTVNDGVMLGSVSGMLTSYIWRPPTRTTFYFKVAAASPDNISSNLSGPSNGCFGGVFNYCLPSFRSDIYSVFQQNASEATVFACDGDDNNKWCVTGIDASNDRAGLYIKLVPDGAASGTNNENLPLISSFRILNAGSEQASYIASRWWIQVKTDLIGASGSTAWRTASNWGGTSATPPTGANTPLVRVTNNTANEWIYTLDTPVRARYIRLFTDRGEQSNDWSTIRLYEFQAFGLEDISQPPAITNQRLVMDYDKPGSGVNFEAQYSVSGASQFVQEYGTTFEWYKRTGGVYEPLVGYDTKAISLPNSLLNGAEAIKVIVTPKLSNGKTGAPAEIEYVYNKTNANVILGQKLVATSGFYADNERPENLVNGGAPATNKWCQRYISPSSPGFAEFDMTGVYRIDRFVLYHCQWGQSGTNYDNNVLLNTKDFKIEYSLDGDLWFEAFHETENLESISTHVLLKPILARFVRLTVYLPSNLTDTTNPTMDGDFAAVRIQELEAYGSFVQFGLPDAFGGLELTRSNGNGVKRLSDAAGATLKARVPISADYLRTADRDVNINLYAALYDASERLIKFETAPCVLSVEPDGSGALAVDISLPASVSGLKYKLFIWDGITYVPLDEGFVF